jgi:hypothetical protein
MARRPGAAVIRHPSQLLTLTVGVVYTLVGMAGFLVTSLEHFASETDKTLLGFEVNPLHNIVHLVIGPAGQQPGDRHHRSRGGTTPGPATPDDATRPVRARS